MDHQSESRISRLKRALLPPLARLDEPARAALVMDANGDIYLAVGADLTRY
jgi:hypothetical protein